MSYIYAGKKYGKVRLWWGGVRRKLFPNRIQVVSYVSILDLPMSREKTADDSFGARSHAVRTLGEASWDSAPSISP